MRRITIVLAVLTAAALTATAALAASPHLRHGSGISCTVSTSTGGLLNDTVTCIGTGGLAGLGNADWAFVLSGTGLVSYTCRNPGNGNEAPGQNKAPATIAPSSTTGTGADITNGNLPFFGNDANGNPTNTLTSTATAVSQTGKQAGCPSNSWTAFPNAVFWTSVTIVFEQPVPTVVITCTKSDPNGLTGTFSLVCS